MTREQSYAKAFENQKNALMLKKATFEAAMQKLSAENAAFAETNKKLSCLGAQLAITAISGDSAALAKMQSEMTALSNERSEILKSAGIADIEYACTACRDTGYINGKICSCIHDSAKEILVQSLSTSLPLDSCRFENFDLNYYPTENADGKNPKKRMTQILKLCREYAINFDPKLSGSLLFMGNAGLGKTHLTLSVVYELLNRGFNVIYGAAYNLFGEMESEHFDRHTNIAYNAAVGCDLLVIDDLGSEFVSPYIQSLLYNIINTRDLANLPTIINTNLTMSEIEDKYTARISSRLQKYTAKKFIGNDIRQLKAIEKSKI